MVPADLQHLLAQAKVTPTHPKWIKIHLCVSVGHEPAPGRRFVSPTTLWEQRCVPTTAPPAWGPFGKSISIMDLAKDAAPALAGNTFLRAENGVNSPTKLLNMCRVGLAPRLSL